MKNIKSLITKIKSQEEKLQNQILDAYADGMKAISAEATAMIGKKVSIDEPISPRLRGRLVYKIVKINRITRDFYGDPTGPIVLEYTAELVSKPKNYRHYLTRKVGATYNKRITLSENGFKVMKVVK